MGEGGHRGEVAGECVGQEAQPKGAEKTIDGFRAVQGYEIEEASTLRGPEVFGQGQGGIDAVMDLGLRA